MPPTGGGSPARNEGIRLDELEENINEVRLHATMFSQGKGMFALAGLADTRDEGLCTLVSQWTQPSAPSHRSFVLAVLLHAKLISWKPIEPPSARSSALIADADAAIKALWSQAGQATQKALNLSGATSVTSPPSPFQPSVEVGKSAPMEAKVVDNGGQVAMAEVRCYKGEA